MIPMAIQAGLWGLLAGSALLIGAVIAYYVDISQRMIASIMAFGSGVLISALSFEMMDHAYLQGGFATTALGFLSGAAIFTIANIYLSRRGAKHRKRSGHQQPRERDHQGSGMAIALASVLDGIPESIVVGLSLVTGPHVSMTAVIAIFLSNIPEGLSSAAGMKKAGRSARYIFLLWSGISVLLGLASLAGFVWFSHLPAIVTAAATALAAGSLLAMLAETMIPEAFEIAHDYVGFITVAGFITAFYLSKTGA